MDEAKKEYYNFVEKQELGPTDIGEYLEKANIYIKELEKQIEDLKERNILLRELNSLLEKNKQLIYEALVHIVVRHKKTYGNIIGFDSEVIKVIETTAKKSIEEILDERS